MGGAVPDPFAGVRRLAVLLATLALLHALGAAWWQGATYDEGSHLRWSERILDDGNFERASSPFFNSKTPVSIPNALAWKLAGEGGRGARFASRLPTVLALALLLAAASRLGSRLGGPVAGAVTLAALALDPNLRAHGSLATVDAVFALATVLAVLAGMRFAERPGALSGLAVGAALGFAVLAKLSGLWLILPVLAAPPLVGLGAESGAGRARRVAGGLALAACGGWLVLALGYGLHGLGAAHEMAWRSTGMRALAPRAGPLLDLLPAPLLTGIDASLADERQLPWRVVLLGRSWPGGVPWYFAFLALVKTPLALLAAALAGLGVALRRGLLREPRARFVAVVLGVLLAYFSFFFRAQLGYRYVLMCLPLGYALAARGGAALLPARRPAVALGAVALLAIVEQAPFGLDPLAFTNSLVVDKARAFEVVADSNLDWGQNDARARAWVEAQGPTAHLDPPHPQVGLDLYAANALVGITLRDSGQSWLRSAGAPDRTLFFTHFLYRVDREAFDRFLDQARRLPAEPPCALAEATRRLTPGRRRQPVGAGVLCLRADAVTDLRIDTGARPQTGVGWVDRASGSCRSRPVAARQSVWFRLEPGFHTLCVRGPVRLAVERGALAAPRRSRP